MSLQGFWNATDRGEVNFVWVNMNDGLVCPDCLAIAAQQPAGGATWAEWQQFGFPGSMHTVCLIHCRCRMAPVLYAEQQIEVPPEVSDLNKAKFVVNFGGGFTPQQTRILTLSSAIEETGFVLRTLKLRGLTLTEMETVLQLQADRLGLQVVL